ncbi:hypothetical protein MNBD_GAMMA08-1646 [hydrothermal vent metagenome]|uniref:Uncharacterized protein n=1 Tax=hydrothermal vent metagenome TaxID=652676 RepID=A0A3B0XB21_9ZZZZ
MTFDFWINTIEGQPALSVLIWVSLLIIVLYMARQPAHQVILLLARGVRNTLRLMAQSVMLAERQLKSRNREVLMAQGQKHAERFIEREFQRVETLVNRDLSGYPSLQRDLKEQITRIDEDYVHSSEIPPKPPEWLKAVEAVAGIPDNGSPVVAKILNDIHNTLKKALETDLQEYRRANRERHGLLKKMMPFWRLLTNSLNSVERKITGLEQRSIIIDTQMQTYEDIRNQTDYAERMLSSSSMTQFFISGLALCLAIIGMYVNFQLVALPMEEMVGAASYLGSSSIRASDVSALFIISIEVILGLFLMESVGVTQLFPVIHLLEDHKRKMIFWIMLSFLFIFAGIEASLAYMRDMLAADREALSQLLTGVEVAEPPLRWIPSLGQMIMGFILPFVLTFVAIPLESFIHSFRTVSGLFGVWLLHMLVVSIRFTANVIFGLGRMLISVYDLVIFIPLKIESLFRSNKDKDEEEKISGILTHQNEKAEE